MKDNPKKESLRLKLHTIIFEADTKWGKWFDEALMVLILLSVIVVMLDSVVEFRTKYSTHLFFLEWFFTIIFSVEYLLRIWTVKKPEKYIFSFYGIIDLLSILPTYVSFFLIGSHYMMVIRILRILRIFRVFKLVKFLKASNLLMRSLSNSKYKIGVFFLIVLFTVTIFGSIMYIVEGAQSGFTSIPRGIYWAIVTLTTVGYGDIAPSTVIGQSIASMVMLLGYAIIAVPTGILTSEIVSESKRESNLNNTQVCSNCHEKTHTDNAKYCDQCGTSLNINFEE